MPWGSVAFQVLPMTDAPKGCIYEAVDLAIAVVDAAGVKYTVGPMETVMEGEIQALLEIIYRAQQAVKQAGISRVATYVKIFNSDERSTSEEKVAKYRAAGH